VKRHPALAGLSHDHHRELVQARRLRAAAEAGPEERLATATAYVDVFFTETVAHFRAEEERLFPAYVRVAGDTHALVAASGAGDDREVASREPQFRGEQPQQRLVGAAVLGGCADRRLQNRRPVGEKDNPLNPVGPPTRG